MENTVRRPQTRRSGYTLNFGGDSQNGRGHVGPPSQRIQQQRHQSLTGAFCDSSWVFTAVLFAWPHPCRCKTAFDSLVFDCSTRMNCPARAPTRRGLEINKLARRRSLRPERKLRWWMKMLCLDVWTRNDKGKERQQSHGLFLGFNRCSRVEFRGVDEGAFPSELTFINYDTPRAKRVAPSDKRAQQSIGVGWSTVCRSVMRQQLLQRARTR